MHQMRNIILKDYNERQLWNIRNYCSKFIIVFVSLVSVLYRPLSLELTAVNEDIVMDNVEVFRKNGFEFYIDKEGNCSYK